MLDFGQPERSPANSPEWFFEVVFNSIVRDLEGNPLPGGSCTLSFSTE